MKKTFSNIQGGAQNTHQKKNENFQKKRFVLFSYVLFDTISELIDHLNGTSLNQQF